MNGGLAESLPLFTQKLCRPHEFSMDSETRCQKPWYCGLFSLFSFCLGRSHPTFDCRPFWMTQQTKPAELQFENWCVPQTLLLHWLSTVFIVPFEPGCGHVLPGHTSNWTVWWPVKTCVKCHQLSSVCFFYLNFLEINVHFLQTDVLRCLASFCYQLLFYIV